MSWNKTEWHSNILGASVVQLCSRVWLHVVTPMDCIPPGSSVYGVFQARVLLECVAISFSRGIFLTQVSNLSLLHYRQTLYRWATRCLEGTTLITLQKAFLLLITHFSCLVFLKNYFLSFLFLEIRSCDGWLEFILLDRERSKEGLHQFFVLFFYSTSLPSSRAKAPCQDKPKIFACLSPQSFVWRMKESFLNNKGTKLEMQKLPCSWPIWQSYLFRYCRSLALIFIFLLLFFGEAEFIKLETELAIRIFKAIFLKMLNSKKKTVFLQLLTVSFEIVLFKNIILIQSFIKHNPFYRNTLKILVREVYDNQGMCLSVCGHAVYKEEREKEGILDEKIEASL